MTPSTQRLDRAADEIERLFKNPSAVSLEEIARAVVSAYLGDDMVVVPREPTAKMRRAAVEADDKRTGSETCAHIYRAMISASLTERDAG